MNIWQNTILLIGLALKHLTMLVVLAGQRVVSLPAIGGNGAASLHIGLDRGRQFTGTTPLNHLQPLQPQLSPFSLNDRGYRSIMGRSTAALTDAAAPRMKLIGLNLAAELLPPAADRAAANLLRPPQLEKIFVACFLIRKALIKLDLAAGKILFNR